MNEQRTSNDRIRNALRVLAILILIGLAVIALYAATAPGIPHILAAVSVSGVTAGATLMVGGGLGFLFGIPRTLQSDAVDVSRVTTYRANTNLEQISDWLTKILVGVGLTQLASLPDGLQRLTAFIAQGLGDSPAGQPFALSIILYFGFCGFLYGYLWTRLYLAGALQAAEDLNDRVSKEKVNSQALSLTKERLSSDAPAPSEADLTAAIKGASAEVVDAIFHWAYKVRRENWSDNRRLMARTIPIFKALTVVDSNNMEYFGNLGFALKDQRPADWQGALAALDKAIALRGTHEASGWAIYEFNRALCRINMDAAFNSKQASADLERNAIIDDLKMSLNDDGYVRGLVETYDTIGRWLELNKLKVNNLAGTETDKPDEP